MRFKQEVLVHLYKARGINNICKYFGVYDYERIMTYFRNDVHDYKDKSLTSLKKYAQIIDVPVEFLISIFRMEGFDDDATSRRRTSRSNRKVL